MRRSITRFLTSPLGMIVTGGLIGLIAATLQKFGNPPNMGFCVACFERDIAGALGLHRAAVVQTLRPEIPGLLLGGTLGALLFGEWRARAGGAALVRFLLGVFAMIGALVFLGCPWRALLRLAGGDLNALLGLAGLLAGLSLGAMFTRRGFSLGGASPTRSLQGWLMPLLMLGLLLLALIQPGFLFQSEKGPGALSAPALLSLGGALLVGLLAQRARFCTIGAFRNAFFARDWHLFYAALSLVAVAFLANLAYGQFKLGYAAMPVAHSAWLWNFLGMALAGLAFHLAGGCPGRQLILAGEGSGDSAVFVLGMIVGGGVAHNFLLAAGPDKLADGVLKVGGPGPNGQVAVIVGLVFTVLVGMLMRDRETA